MAVQRWVRTGDLQTLDTRWSVDAWNEVWHSPFIDSHSSDRLGKHGTSRPDFDADIGADGHTDRDLEKDFDAMIAYLEFPEEEWMHLRTTNLIERLNKEFKQRTKRMEIVAGEASVYTLLAFVAMKMEVSWRNAPFRNSGFRKLKPFAGYFTHEG